MTNKMSLSSLPVEGKKVLMRVDFNVPLNEKGEITSDARIVAALPSIKYILDHGGSLVLMSHLGRPKGEKKPELSLKPVAKRLSELLGKEVTQAPDCIGAEVEKIVGEMKTGDVVLLENLRYYNAETKPDSDPSFAKSLATYGDVYVNDAFGTAHRVHSSTVTVAQYFPGNSAAGFLLEKEIAFLGDAVLNPKHPFYAIIGGAKVSTKLGVIKSLMKKVDKLFIGGGMAYTFAKARGFAIGKSIVEEDLIGTAKEIIDECASSGVELVLPEDVVVAAEFKNEAPSKVIDVTEGIPEDCEGLDIGPNTVKTFVAKLGDGATILWNGPLGVNEMPNFAKGSNAVAEGLAKLGATVIVGGGDTLATVHAAGVADKMSHLSTGGGASLEYIEFGTLPGVEALS